MVKVVDSVLAPRGAGIVLVPRGRGEEKNPRDKA